MPILILLSLFFEKWGCDLNRKCSVFTAPIFKSKHVQNQNKHSCQLKKLQTKRLKRNQNFTWISSNLMSQMNQNGNGKPCKYRKAVEKVEVSSLSIELRPKRVHFWTMFRSTMHYSRRKCFKKACWNKIHTESVENHWQQGIVLHSDLLYQNDLFIYVYFVLE